ncbi:MAG: flavin reductase family protein [Methanobacterium sp.]|nr:flavin reductase family protein [Methanobacterium sp.]
MGKIKLGSNVFIPMPVTLLGIKIDGKANFMALGWVSRLNASPPLIGAAINKYHYSSEGIRENETFSINIPSENLIKETDYCGLVSGRETDKSTLFNVFYGETGSAPLIEECPLSLECKLVDIYEMPSNELIIGEIVETYLDKDYIKDDAPDVKKMNPLFLTMPDNNYWNLGENVGKAWDVGKELKLGEDESEYV